MRRLLASQAGPARTAAPADAVPARSPADFLAAARRFAADVLPALRTFSGPGLTWNVRQVRSGGWDDVAGLPLASALSVDHGAGPELAALAACGGSFLRALMASLFGLVSEHRRDPTASELTVFAQLVVALRDVIDPDLEHAPPGPPGEALRFFAPPDPAPLIVELDATFERTEGRLALVMTGAVASRFLPPEAPAPRSAGGMSRLPLKGELALPGPRLRLQEIAGLAVDAVLPVSGDVRLSIAGRSVALGRLGRSDGARTVTLDPSLNDPAR